MPMPSLSLVTTLFGFLIAIILHVRRKQKTTCSLPPGPIGLPMIGNPLDIPKSREWVTYEKWGKEFGKFDRVTSEMSLIVALNI